MIGLERARELLKAALDTQGREFVYNLGGPNDKPCLNIPYVDGMTDIEGDLLEAPPEGDPKRLTGCIAGTALTLGGVAIGAGYEASNVFAFDSELTTAAQYYLAEAQVAQDNGHPWGEAYDRAEDWYTRNADHYRDHVDPDVLEVAA